MGGEVMVDLRLMSLKAFFENRKSLDNKTQMAASIIRKSKDKGISAQEYAKIVGACCKHEVSPALSRALKEYNDIVKLDDETKTHGRYYSKPAPDWDWVGVLNNDS
jgi:hypothetical protein